MVDNDNEICIKDDVSKESFCRSTIALKSYLKNTLDTILNNVTDEKFIEIYKRCYQAFERKNELAKPALSGSSVEARMYRKQFNKIITDTVIDSIGDTLLNLDPKMRNLEELKNEQSANLIIWRPPGIVSEHMIPFECVSLIETTKELEKRIEKEREAVNTLKPRIIQKRLRAQELHQELLTLYNSIKETVTERTDILQTD